VTNISCLLVGGEELYEHAKKKLGIGHKETSADGQFSLERSRMHGRVLMGRRGRDQLRLPPFRDARELDQLIDGLRKAQ